MFYDIIIKHEKNIACFSDFTIPIYLRNCLQLESFEIWEGSEFAEAKDERNESPNCHKYWQHGRAVVLGIGVCHPGPTRFPPGRSWLLKYDLITPPVSCNSYNSCLSLTSSHYPDSTVNCCVLLIMIMMHCQTPHQPVYQNFTFWSSAISSGSCSIGNGGSLGQSLLVPLMRTIALILGLSR